ncbi:hypothetical protein FSP39_014324 [Pinctada imbricata]|uniref:Translin-associated protein X n=1 Tax=Pinctada imbricata TaxID=66713 RepID=A0AA88Y6Y6_PINIB|nr:hypothetical protein FSP39_014324 [Pinctada imbricata]
MFRVHQGELDMKHDKHERLVKLSRDITIESKRTIFLLQRYTGPESNPSVLEQALSKIQDIQKQKFHQVAMELKGEEPYQFLRAYSPGLQEYIEALSFYHYIKSKRLVSLDEVQKDLIFTEERTDVSDDSGVKSDISGENQNTNSGPDTQVVSNSDRGVIEVFVPPSEYMLGLADLTGELMRLAINSVGVGNLDTPFEVCSFLREMRSAFSSLQYVSREMNRKVSVLNQSLQKVETACYTLQVRGSEIPKHMLADVFSSGPSHGPMFEEDNVTQDD